MASGWAASLVLVFVGLAGCAQSWQESIPATSTGTADRTGAGQDPQAGSPMQGSSSLPASTNPTETVAGPYTAMTPGTSTFFSTSHGFGNVVAGMLSVDVDGDLDEEEQARAKERLRVLQQTAIHNMSKAFIAGEDWAEASDYLHAQYREILALHDLRVACIDEEYCESDRGMRLVQSFRCNQYVAYQKAPLDERDKIPPPFDRCTADWAYTFDILVEGNVWVEVNGTLVYDTLSGAQATRWLESDVPQMVTVIGRHVVVEAHRDGPEDDGVWWVVIERHGQILAFAVLDESDADGTVRAEASWPTDPCCPIA